MNGHSMGYLENFTFKGRKQPKKAKKRAFFFLTEPKWRHRVSNWNFLLTSDMRKYTDKKLGKYLQYKLDILNFEK